MADSEERAGGELRVSGRTLTGTALVYGDRAVIAGGVVERFQPGAFGPEIREAPLVMGHDDSLVIALPGAYELRDSAAALEVTAELGERSAALGMVRDGILRGFSIKFVPLAESREAAVRVIGHARLQHVGLVTDPAYTMSRAEVRTAPDRRRRWWL